MPDVDPAAFYTGLVADLYTPLRGTGPVDRAPYVAAIRRAGEPALELGCGDGDPLLDLLEAGLDVEGLDSSADMLERCRAEAATRGLSPTLHLGAMQELASLPLPRRYRCIFLAGPTFTLLPDDSAASAALVGMRRHLTDDGTAIVPLFVPAPTPPHVMGVRRTATTPDGVTIAVSAVDEKVDAESRTVVTVLRYERIAPDGSREQEDRPWLRHWYPHERFRALAEAAGLEVRSVRRAAGGEAGSDDHDVVWFLRPR